MIAVQFLHLPPPWNKNLKISTVFLSLTGSYYLISAVVTMSQQTVIKREACETCLELLMIEMVETILRSCDSDLELAGYKLENIGFRVGQKLAERFV
jgi:hypothetical protein